MIKLLTLLKEMAVGRAQLYAWQKPSGELRQITDNDYSHDSVACKITGQMNDPIPILWKKGWNRISYMGDTVYIHNEIQSPSNKQVKAIVDAAIEAEFSKVIFDYGDDQKILWTEFDTLQEVTDLSVDFVSPEEIDNDQIIRM